MASKPVKSIGTENGTVEFTVPFFSIFSVQKTHANPSKLVIPMARAKIL